MPLVDFEGVPQTSDHTCGDCLARTILRYWGRPAGRPLSTPYDGTDPRSLEAVLRLAKLSVLSGHMDLELVGHLTGRGRPVGCLVQREGVGHWVCVRGVLRRRVYFFDPLDGDASEPAAAFRARWSDADRFGVRYDCFGVSAWEA